VIFESGTTVLEAARAALERRIELVAVTNDLAIAQLLGTSPRVRVHVLGGQLRPGSHTLIGDGVVAMAREIRADVLLMGAHAVTDGVLSDTLPEVAAVKRALLGAAALRRLLVDSSKFRPRTFMSVCAVDELHEVITDTGVPAGQAEAVQAAGVKLTQVSVA
jgi:DeoR family transcriptional regulator of aga operon